MDIALVSSGMESTAYTGVYAFVGIQNNNVMDGRRKTGPQMTQMA